MKIERESLNDQIVQYKDDLDTLQQEKDMMLHEYINKQ